jgi:hypothetical protein
VTGMMREITEQKTALTGFPISPHVTNSPAI